MKITIITVCFNSIGDTLRSVANQNYGNIEHIIVDGKSTDLTLKIISEQGGHIAKLISENDGGIYDAMNKGIEAATGEIIGFINSDDFYASNDILENVAAIFEDEAVDCCYGDLCYVDQFDVHKIVRYWRASPFIPNSFRRGWCPPHPTFFARRAIYKRFGKFDLSFKLAADFELMARILEKHRARSVYLEKIFVKMRLGGASNKNISNIYKQNIEIIAALRKLALDYSFLELFIFKFFSKAMQFFRSPS
jgi:glycosyltransferase involved in cell wall biosynthesis